MYISRAIKIIHNESFKDNIYSTGMSCAVNWFHRAHLQKQKKVLLEISQISQENNCAGVSFPAFYFVACDEIWLGWIN